jgi:hypothetical protein
VLAVPWVVVEVLIVLAVPWVVVEVLICRGVHLAAAVVLAFVAADKDWVAAADKGSSKTPLNKFSASLHFLLGLLTFFVRAHYIFWPAAWYFLLACKPHFLQAELGSWVGFAARANRKKPDLELGSWVGFAARANLEKPGPELGSWVG